MSENTPGNVFDVPPQGVGRTGAASEEEEAGFQPPPGGEVPQAESAAIAADVLALAPSELLDVKRAIEEQLSIRAAGPPSTFSVQSFSGSQNIQGVGVGIIDEADAATVNMGEPGAPALILYVAEPTSPDEVRSVVAESVGASPSAVDARAVDQVPIKYVRTGPIDALAHRFRDRPASGGISVGHFKVTAGTIGCFATGRSAPRSARLLVLSNNHVLANVNSAMFGDCICQPGIYDGGRCPDDQIAVLERYIPIDFSGPNFVDCATGWCWPDRVRRDLVVLSGGSRNFFKIGSAPIAPAVGLAVAKSGRTTQLTSGHITAIGVTVNVNYSGGRVASFQDQIAISSTAGNFSEGGDSGSAIFKNDTTRQPVGLLFAGGGSTTFANRMDRVLSGLDIMLSVLTQAPK